MASMNIYLIYIYSIDAFEWDDAKAQQNARSIESRSNKPRKYFDDPRAVPFEDLEHSSIEETST